MKITSLVWAATQVRYAPQRVVTARAYVESNALDDTLCQAATAVRKTSAWTVASRLELRPPLAAKVWPTRAIPQTETRASDALHTAEDDRWPTARGS
jgi:hypothetical protein